MNRWAFSPDPWSSYGSRYHEDGDFDDQYDSDSLIRVIAFPSPALQILQPAGRQI